jgi:hypothetical protein
MKAKKLAIYNLVVVVVLFLLLAGTTYAAWVGPTQAPPSGNVDTPINAGGAIPRIPQIKSGQLGVGTGVDPMLFNDPRIHFQVGNNIAVLGGIGILGNMRIRGQIYDGLNISAEAVNLENPNPPEINIVKIASPNVNPNNPSIRLSDLDAETGATDGGAFIEFINQNGTGVTRDVRIWNYTGNPFDQLRRSSLVFLGRPGNEQDVRIGIGTRDPVRRLTIAGGMRVEGSGHFTGNLSTDGTKPFIQEHPTDPTKNIVYIALEGGEAGTYVRGEGQLVNGEARITIPEHFSLVTEDFGLTAQVTPRDEMNGLRVVSITPKELVVKELKNGKSNVKFYYHINGLRIGYSDHEPIQERVLLPEE